jgi:hypothetical protein
MRIILGILLFALSACAWQPSGYTISDIVLYGIQERHTIFYSKLEAGQTRAIQLENNTVTLNGTSPIGALAISTASSVNGTATLLTKPKAIREIMSVATIPFTSDLSVLTREAVQALYYYDGRKWFDVGSREDLTRDSKLRLELQERNANLRGVGKLSNTESDALQGYLQEKYKQPLAVALLEYPNIPDSYLNLSPRPDGVNLTALYVQVGLPIDLLGGFTNTEPLTLRALNSGSNAAYNSPNPLLRWDTSNSSFANTWKIMNGNQIPPPNAPSLEFNRSSAISFFMGQRPTGGYGVAVANARIDRGVLTIRLNLTEPAPGRLQTQALTSPFVSVLQTGGAKFTRVIAVNNANGTVLAQLERPSN